MDLDTGLVSIDNPKSMTGNVTIIAGAQLLHKPFITNVTFKTPGSPLKSGNLQLIATTRNNFV